MTVRRVLQENRQNILPTSMMAAWAASSNTSYMPYASLPALQGNWYRECHSDIAVEHIYQEIFATQESLEGDFSHIQFYWGNQELL